MWERRLINIYRDMITVCSLIKLMLHKANLVVQSAIVTKATVDEFSSLFVGKASSETAA